MGESPPYFVLFDEVLESAEKGFAVEPEGGRVYLEGTDIEVMPTFRLFDSPEMSPASVAFGKSGNYVVVDSDSVEMYVIDEDGWPKKVLSVDTFNRTVYVGGHIISYTEPVPSDVRAEMLKYLDRETVMGKFLSSLFDGNCSEAGSIIGRAIGEIKGSMRDIKVNKVTKYGVFSGESAELSLGITKKIVERAGYYPFVFFSDEEIAVRVGDFILYDNGNKRWIRLVIDKDKNKELLSLIARLVFASSIISPLKNTLIKFLKFVEEENIDPYKAFLLKIKKSASFNMRAYTATSLYYPRRSLTVSVNVLDNLELNAKVRKSINRHYYRTISLDGKVGLEPLVRYNNAKRSFDEKDASFIRFAMELAGNVSGVPVEKIVEKIEKSGVFT